MNSEALIRVEACIDGKWVAIFSSHHQRLVDNAFNVYRRVCPWKVRVKKSKL
jgi:hypothetical protein